MCGITALRRLQKLQNRSDKIVTDSSYKTLSPPIIENLGWQTVNDLMETETLKMVNKSTNQQAPAYLTSIFQRISEFSNSRLRDSDTDLHVPFHRTAYGQNGFSYRGAKLWNDQYTKAKKAKCWPNSRN